MKPEVKKLWVAALRSGKYTKGVGYLKAEQEDSLEIGYCCLGVLCEISPYPSERHPGGHCFDWKGHMSYLPPDVQEWAGLTHPSTNNPRVPWRGEYASLADINDNTDTTFDTIADLIEEHL
jgi:hypothetical protein